MLFGLAIVVCSCIASIDFLLSYTINKIEEHVMKMKMKTTTVKFKI